MKYLTFLFSITNLCFGMHHNCGTYVGELQERWQFPSDHLPIGITFEGTHYLSWNVLDTKHIHWVIEKNSEGLSRSQIADEHRWIQNSGLTFRDRHIVNLILQMILHSTHPRALIALQECSEPFLNELYSRLPNHFTLITHRDNSVLFNQNVFKCVEAVSRSMEIQELVLERQDTHELLHLLNVHLSYKPERNSLTQLAQYLASNSNLGLTILVMGDMNATNPDISQALQGSPFSVYSPYCTHIHRSLYSQAIDHFLVYCPRSSAVVENAPKEIMEELDPLVSLLEKPSE